MVEILIQNLFHQTIMVNVPQVLYTNLSSLYLYRKRKCMCCYTHVSTFDAISTACHSKSPTLFLSIPRDLLSLSLSMLHCCVCVRASIFPTDRIWLPLSLQNAGWFASSLCLSILVQSRVRYQMKARKHRHFPGPYVSVLDTCRTWTRDGQVRILLGSVQNLFFFNFLNFVHRRTCTRHGLTRLVDTTGQKS